jgi:hypothetical protein
METNTDFVVFAEPFGLDIDKIFDGNPTSRGSAKKFCGKILFRKQPESSHMLVS